MSTSTTSSSGPFILTTNTLKSPADPNLSKGRSHGVQSLTPPTSTNTTPTEEILVPMFSYPHVQDKICLPAGPKDFGCPRPQPREPRRKIPFPRQGDTKCPYTIPKRKSSYQTARTHHDMSKVSKALAQHVSKTQQRSRSLSSTSSKSSTSSSLSSSLCRSSLSTVQKAMETQAQIKPSPSRTRTSSNVASMEIRASSRSAPTLTIVKSACSSVRSPHITGDLPNQVYPLLHCDTSTATLSSSSSTLSTPSSASRSGYISTVEPYNNFTYPDDLEWLAICEPFTTDMNLVPDTSLDTSVAIYNSSSPCTTVPQSTTINRSGRTHTNSLQLQTQFPLPGQSTPQACSVTSGISQSTSQTPISALSATSTSSSYSNSFVPISQGGGGMLVNTSRLKGRVMRPWN